jgi:hypothetical protein
MKRILILAANPRQDLDLRREIHILKSVIERSQEGEEFEIKIDSAVRPQNLQKLFLEYKPRIIHFCGHGTGEQGLVLEDGEGAEKLVSTFALSDLFKNFSDQVECVLLNACYSEQQADVIKDDINYVIGMSQAIKDDAAIVFARGFYQALAYGKPIPDAFDLGCNAIQLQISNANNSQSNFSEKERKLIAEEEINLVNLPEHLKPKLKQKSPLTFFSENKTQVVNSFPFPDLTEAIQEEISRQRYRENCQKDFGLGKNILHQGLPLTQQDYRYEKVLLSKVKDSWIKGVLEKSLHSKVLFELHIKERLDVIHRPFSDLEELSNNSDKSFEWLQASDVFEEMETGRTLLILGEPGTGKTISLLKLAERLIKRTEQDFNLPIPVVFNLSSWGNKRQSISDWLVTELKEKYQVSKSLGKQWIEQERLILLLDGLDEVKAEYRNACVAALNKFIEAHGITEMVACSRIRDYEALSERIKLRSAICIQPLTSEYIDWYLQDVGKPLEGLKILLKKDQELTEFAKTPLILNIMSLTYEGLPSEILLQQLGSKEERYQHLFDNYIDRMLQRKKNDNHYLEKSTKYWLAMLAKNLKKSSQTIFVIEQLQPTWLTSIAQKNIYFFSISLLCSIIGLSIGLIISILYIILFYRSPFGLPIENLILDVMFLQDPIRDFMSSISIGLFGGGLLGFLGGLWTGISRQINPINALRWSLGEAIKGFFTGTKISVAIYLIIHITQSFLMMGREIQNSIDYCFASGQQPILTIFGISVLPFIVGFIGSKILMLRPIFEKINIRLSLIPIILLGIFLGLSFSLLTNTIGITLAINIRQMFMILGLIIGVERLSKSKIKSAYLNNITIIFILFFSCGLLLKLILILPHLPHLTVNLATTVDGLASLILFIFLIIYGIFIFNQAEQKTNIYHFIRHSLEANGFGLALAYIAWLYSSGYPNIFYIFNIEYLKNFLATVFLFVVPGFLSALYFGWTNTKIQNDSNLNQGIGRYIKFSLMITGLFSLVFGIFTIVILKLFPYNPITHQHISKYGVLLILFSTSILLALSIGLLSSLPLIQHFFVRIILYFHGLFSWNYRSFLNHATERLLMQKVGNGYIFVHRMLMEHFARMKQD